MIGCKRKYGIYYSRNTNFNWTSSSPGAYGNIVLTSGSWSVRKTIPARSSQVPRSVILRDEDTDTYSRARAHTHAHTVGGRDGRAWRFYTEWGDTAVRVEQLVGFFRRYRPRIPSSAPQTDGGGVSVTLALSVFTPLPHSSRSVVDAFAACARPRRRRGRVRYKRISLLSLDKLLTEFLFLHCYLVIFFFSLFTGPEEYTYTDERGPSGVDSKEKKKLSSTSPRERESEMVKRTWRRGKRNVDVSRPLQKDFIEYFYFFLIIIKSINRS